MLNRDQKTTAGTSVGAIVNHIIEARKRAREEEKGISENILINIQLEQLTTSKQGTDDTCVRISYSMGVERDSTKDTRKFRISGDPSMTDFRKCFTNGYLPTDNKGTINSGWLRQTEE